MESAEHIWIGDQVILQRPGGAKAAKGLSILTVADQKFTNTLRYGQIIALAGDFYGVLGHQISMAKPPDQSAAFRAAWDSLAHGDPGELHEILEILREEVAAIDQVLAADAEGGGRKTEPSQVYAALGDSLSHRWNGATGGSYRDWLPAGRYLRLAAENFDHFGRMAWAAYEAGHRVAREQAAEARKRSGDEAAAMLDTAYAMNAFADHFLTDLFSAGHLRVPRKELYDALSGIGDLGLAFSGPLVRGMHNEDGWNGLTVRNGAGVEWVAFGDTRLLDSVSAKNRAQVVQAVQASVDDVWAAFNGRMVPSSAQGLVPDVGLLLAETADHHVNRSPLFRFNAPDVLRRDNLENTSSFTWVKGWDPIWTALWLSNLNSAATQTQYVHARCYTLHDGTFIGWLWSDSKGNARLARNEVDAHGVCWNMDGNDLYLQKDTQGGDRYLGLGDRNYASWGRPGPYRCPVVYSSEDYTIGLAADPTRKLFLDNDDWLSWTASGTDNKNILKVVVPPPGSPYC